MPNPDHSPRFVNRIEVRPTTSDVTLILERVYSEAAGESFELRAEEVHRVVMPYVAVKVLILNLLACVHAAEHGSGFIPVAHNLRPGLPTAEHIGTHGATQLAALAAQMFERLSPQPVGDESESPARMH